eukprot:751231-Hanusia_phi.AAC.6
MRDRKQSISTPFPFLNRNVGHINALVKSNQNTSKQVKRSNRSLREVRPNFDVADYPDRKSLQQLHSESSVMSLGASDLKEQHLVHPRSLTGDRVGHAQASDRVRGSSSHHRQGRSEIEADIRVLPVEPKRQQSSRTWNSSERACPYPVHDVVVLEALVHHGVADP